MDLPTLCSVLQACMSPDKAQRDAAEAVLKQHERSPGQATNLLRVAAEASVDPAIRQVAAISFKNLVKRSWEPAETDTTSHRLAPEEKQVVRENLLESTIWAPHQVQVQLGEVLKTAVHADFPEQWPTLLQALTANLTAPDPVRVHGALYALRIVARKYEFRDEEERGPLTAIINTSFPALLHILQQLAAAPLTPDNCVYTRLACKTFWSATYMGIPDFLLVPENLRGWMNLFLTMARLDLPDDQQPANKEDRPSSPWWKSRKWLFHIFYRIISRYAFPKHCKEGNDQEFAKVFQREFAIPFLDVILGKVAGLAAGQYSSPRVTNLVFQYLSVAMAHKNEYKHVGAHWDSILINVAFPLMCFSDEDAQLWQEDPYEYIRKGYDILEDMYSPKTAVANFAFELCQKKKEHLDHFLANMVAILQQYHAAAAAHGGQVDTGLVRRMDGALLVIGVLSEVLTKKKPYKQQLGGMLLNFVVPLFTCPYGHLRAKAVWVAGTYADIQFPDGQGSGPTFTALFGKAVGLLSDPDLPVRVDTVVALRQFIDAAEDTDSLKPVLPTLLNHIFHLMGELDVEDLVFSLEALVDKFGQDIAPYAVQMVTQLAAAFERYASNEEEEDDEQSGLAAFGCMRALNTVLESVCGLGPELFPVLEKALLPLLYRLLSSEGQELLEEVLEMLAYLTFFGPGISQDVWKTWPRMHALVMDFGIDYWENLLVPLENMVCRDTHTFLTSRDPDYQTSAYQMIEYSLNGDFTDGDIVPACQLADVIMQACRGQVDPYIAPYVRLALTRYARTERKKLKDALANMVANALYYNPLLALQALQQAGAIDTFFHHWFSMIMAAKPTGKMPHFKRLQDKKVCVLGLVSVLSVPVESLPPGVLQSGQAHLLSGIHRVLVAYQTQEEEVNKAREDAEEESEEEEEEGEEDDTLLEAEGGEEEEEEEEEDEYLKKLEKRAKAMLKGLGGGSDDDSDDEWTDDEEVTSPIDDIDPFILYADTLAGLAASQPAKHAQLMAVVQASKETTATLTGLMTSAETRRAEKAKAAAEANGH